MIIKILATAAVITALSLTVLPLIVFGDNGKPDIINSLTSIHNKGKCFFDKNDYLHSFNCGRMNDGDDIREFTLIVKEHTIINITSEGQQFDGWTFNGTIPGPTLRMTEGDHVRITVINDKSNNHTHSLHMHSIHNGTMDGIFNQSGSIAPGKNYTYDFIAQPAGLYPYHCHVSPIEDHINRGLYGMMIIDPKKPREKMNEMAMLMNGYDLNYEQEGKGINPPQVNKTNPLKFIPADNEERDNEIYTVNGKAFMYMNDPIVLQKDQKYRIYLVNMLEFDLVNSFHVHGMMFDYFPSGIGGDKPAFTNDIVTLSQGDRGIIEMTPKETGLYMFHAHQTEFTDKGWMGLFKVVE